LFILTVLACVCCLEIISQNYESTLVDIYMAWHLCHFSTIAFKDIQNYVSNKKVRKPQRFPLFPLDVIAGDC
jgi:hypothetical protein